MLPIFETNIHISFLNIQNFSDYKYHHQIIWHMLEKNQIKKQNINLHSFAIVSWLWTDLQVVINLKLNKKKKYTDFEG